MPADPHSLVADPYSPELEAAPPSPPIIILSEYPTQSTSREVVALSDSPSGDGGTTSSSGEEGELTTGDCGSVGTGSTRAGVD